jgi:cytochrome c-type biogenesis protein CcmH
MRYALAGGFLLTFAAAAVTIYLVVGSRHSLEPGPTAVQAPHPMAAPGAGAGSGAPAKSMDAEVAALEARLARNGGTQADWTLLAQAYDFLGRKEDAQRARERAASAPASAPSASPGSSAAAVAGTESLRDLSAGMLALARSSSMSTGGTGRPASAGAPAATVSAGATVSGDATAAPVEVSGTVSLDSRFASRVQKDATLFIYAKSVDSPGPPLAVLRTTANAWPVSFRLDDSMSMIPSRRLSQFDKVVIEARISRSGQAAPAPGDLYVTSEVLRPSATPRLALVINREIG